MTHACTYAAPGSDSSIAWQASECFAYSTSWVSSVTGIKHLAVKSSKYDCMAADSAEAKNHKHTTYLGSYCGEQQYLVYSLSKRARGEPL
eukprot:6214644-Pleurochrysis_carterae.AAC.1